jgi:outer membrane receptor protein involved in Fe transport
VGVPALAAGARRDVGVTLAALAQLDVVSVVAERERPLLNTEDAATGGSVERAELERLPTDARDPIALGYTIPGVAQATGFFGDAPRLSINGANALYTQYALDGLENNEGFLGGPRVEVPLAALSRLTVLANTYSSAFGRSSNGVVNMESRAAGERWAGELFAYNRPGIPVDARAPIVPGGQDASDFRRAQEGFRRTQLGGAAGGPLRAGRTYAFGALEYTNENEDRVASTASAVFLGREVRETYKLFGRVDHGWSPTQTTTLRVAASDVGREGRGSGIVAPEADIVTERRGTATALVHRSALRGGRASNEAAIQLGTFRWNFPPARSDFRTPQVTIRRVVGGDTVSVGVVGSSNFVFDERERQLQLKETFEADVGGGHRLRVGADAWRSWFELAGSQTNPAGSYVVLDEGNVPSATAPGGGVRYAFRDIPPNVRVLSYTVDAAQKQVDLTQTLVGAFVEDRWRVTPSLTVNLGVRWDYDDLTARGESAPDLNNVQPRASLSWLVTPTSVVRAGAGLYAGKFPYTVYSDAVQFGPDGNQTVTFAGAQAPAFLQGPRTATLDRATLPPGEQRRLFALGLEQPMSAQYSLGVQRQLGARVGASLDVVYVDTRNLPRSWDLNASARRVGAADTVSLPVGVGDAARPVVPAAGGYRRLTTTESGGRAEYAGLYAELRYRATRTLLLDANWVWSRSRNDTEDINFNATQGNDFAAEWADAVNDRRHKVAVRGSYTGVRRLLLAGILDFQTGTPVNRVANFRDLDGSGDTFGNGFLGNQDRYFGVPRNGERLPSAFRADASAAYALPTRAGEVQLRADVFNVLNSTNAGGFANGIPGGGSRTQVGRPGDPIVLTSAAPPRQVQLSARVAF